MKKNILAALAAVALAVIAGFLWGFLWVGGYRFGIYLYDKTHSNQQWTPKIGDRVQTTYREDNSVGPPFVTTITNVVNVGSRSQTGLIVYGDGLPGVDSWWVKPAP